MVLDIALFREKGGNPELIRESQRRKFKDVTLVDKIQALDSQLREATHKLSLLNRDSGTISKQVAMKKKAGEDAQELVDQANQLNEQIDKAQAEVKELQAELDKTLPLVGNLVHDSVPVSEDEKDNTIVRTFGELRKAGEGEKPLLQHDQLMERLDAFDMVRGAEVAGHRGYFLKTVGVKLNLAIIQYGLDFLEKRNYTLLSTPFFMLRKPMSETAQLEQFHEELYKVVGDADESADKEKYLIATSEQPISAFHRGEHLNPKDLPLRYGGISTCFRKEAGAHGKDVRGIFRVHQFEKVEQFCITDPEKSWDMHEEMLRTSEEFYQSLNIPYRVVTIVSKELNNAAAKKYDLEGYFPGFAEFRELVSCSNCTDYQSRSLKIHCGMKKKGEKPKFVHMLNSTLCATTRTICCILENYQTEDGVVVPEVLRPYLGGREFFPFTQELKQQSEKGKAKPAKKGGDTEKDA
jgi:seryl-tRNA synthetase